MRITQIIFGLIILFFGFMIMTSCKDSVKEVEIKKVFWTNTVYKEYSNDSLYYREVFDGKILNIRDRVQTNIFRISNGNIKETIIYNDNGVDTSKILFYDSLGRMNIVSKYNEGILNGEYEAFDTIGNLIMKGSMKNGKMNDIWIEYFSTGEMKSKFSLLDGTQHGFDSLWNKSGNLIESYEYEYGEIVNSYKELIE